MTQGAWQRTVGKSQVWLTPPHILRALGTFDLDPCAAPAPRPWSTASMHYDITQGQDGLVLPWKGRVWGNFPYDRRALPRWLERLVDHGIGTALLFARTDTGSWFRSVWGKAEGALFLRGRLHFHLPTGELGDHRGGAPPVLVAYGEEDAERLYNSGLDGHFVPVAPTCALFVFARAAHEAIPAWREVVASAVRDLGGTATLADLYAHIEGHPKTQRNPHWREKIRQVARAHCQRIAAATYRLEAA